MNKILINLLFFSIISNGQNFNFQRSWGTYFGDDRFLLQDSKVSKNGDLYIVGTITTISNPNLATPIFSTPNVYQSTYGGGDTDGFIAKFNNVGQLVFTTYFGGSGNDSVNGIDIDSNNNIFVVGVTNSTNNIATTNSFQTIYAGNDDFFIASFSQTGAIIWGSYYGSSGGEQSYPGNDGNVIIKRLQICNDFNDNFYIAGLTSSSNLGTIGTFQETRQQAQSIIAKFDNSGNRLWCTYYGINGNYITSLSANLTNLYVRGNVFECSPPFNIINSYYGTANSFQQNPNSCVNTFFTKFDINGQRVWSTYYPSDKSFTNNIKVNRDKIYISGNSTNSTLVTTAGSFQATSSTDIATSHLVQFNDDGTRNWGTYCGILTASAASPFGADSCNISIDQQNNIYLSGTTGLNSNIATSGAFMSTNTGTDGYIAKFNDQGQKIWGTYYGGNQRELDMICHPYNDNFFVVGNTQSTTGLTSINGYQQNIANTEPNNNPEPINIFISHFEPIPLSNIIFNQYEISIYPNPADNFIEISNLVIENKKISYKIIEITGRIIKIDTLNNNNRINLENLAKGNYILQIETNDGKLITNKIIKK